MVGDIIQITKIFYSWAARYPSPLYVVIGLAQRINQLATHIRELAVGDKVVEIFRHINLSTLVNGITKF